MKDTVVEEARELLLNRSDKGKVTYGVTLDRTDLTEYDWLTHAIEECSDLLLYLMRLRRDVRARLEVQRDKQLELEFTD